MWVMYVIGVAVALIGVRLMKSTLFKGDGEIYLMELPPYRMPTLKSLLLHMWDRGRMYLQKAGTVILATSIILYICNTWPEKQVFSQDYDKAAAVLTAKAASAGVADKPALEAERTALENARQAEILEYTISGRVGRFLEPVFRPLGFDWRIATASIGALAAKEIFVSQLGILFAEGETDENSATLRNKLAAEYSRLQGFCIMLFCLLSIPCLATLAIIRRELNSTKLALAEAGLLFTVAYLITLIVYQLGSFFRIGV